MAADSGSQAHHISALAALAAVRDDDGATQLAASLDHATLAGIAVTLTRMYAGATIDALQRNGMSEDEARTRTAQSYRAAVGIALEDRA